MKAGSGNIDHPNLADLHTHLVFDLVPFLGIDQGFTQRGMNPELSSFQIISIVDDGEGEFAACASQSLNLHVTAKLDHGAGRHGGIYATLIIFDFRRALRGPEEILFLEARQSPRLIRARLCFSDLHHIVFVDIPGRRRGQCSPALPGCLERCIDGLPQPLHLGAGVIEPVRRPDSMEPPAQPLEDLLAQPIPVPARLGGMIARAIALHAEDETIRPVGMPNAEIDPIAGGAHLRDNLATKGLDLGGYVVLERALGFSRTPDLVRDMARGAILQPGAEHSHPARLFFASQDVGRLERGKGHDLALRAGEEHVQPAVTVRRVDRPETLVNPGAGAFRAVECRDEHHIALVALDRLQVLDEELFERVITLLPVAHVVLDMRVALQLALKVLANELLLIGVHGADAEREVRMIAHMRHCSLHDLARLDLVRAPLVDSRNLLEMYTELRIVLARG